MTEPYGVIRTFRLMTNLSEFIKPFVFDVADKIERPLESRLRSCIYSHKRVGSVRFFHVKSSVSSDFRLAAIFRIKGGRKSWLIERIVISSDVNYGFLDETDG